MIKTAMAALVLCWAGASVCGKAVRYATPGDLTEARAERGIRVFLQAEGWRETGRSDLTSNGTYTALWFSRAGCPMPVGVAVLGSGAEATDAVRRVLGTDVAYLEAGRLAPQPHVSSYALRALLEAAMERLGGPRRPLIPVLAITPAPRSGAAACTGVAPEKWERLRNVWGASDAG